MSELTSDVNAALYQYAQFDADCPVRLGEAIRHSLLAPCKRLRPLLVLMAAEACGCDLRKAMPAACAVEMVHTYSLIHDDLPAMDDDDLRRGRPSCHAAFDEATAILAGDALLAQAFEILATDIKPADLAARCCAALAQAAGASALVGGQVDDLAAESSDRHTKHQTKNTQNNNTATDNADAGEALAALEAIHRRKTGAMFRVSLSLGGMIGGADEAQLAALDSYAAKLGLAFQIIDDLLDSEGTTAELGKSTGKDAAQGKLTFPALLGAGQSRTRAKELIDQACASLAGSTLAGGALDALARFVLERNR